jgi:hypothetical protein
MATGQMGRTRSDFKISSGRTMLNTLSGSSIRSRCSAVAPPTLLRPNSWSSREATNIPKTSGTPGSMIPGQKFRPKRSSRITRRMIKPIFSCWRAQSSALYGPRAASNHRATTREAKPRLECGALPIRPSCIEYPGEDTRLQRAKHSSVPVNQKTINGLTTRLGRFPEAATPGGAAPVSIHWRGLALRPSSYPNIAYGSFGKTFGERDDPHHASVRITERPVRG